MFMINKLILMKNDIINKSKVRVFTIRVSRKEP